MLEKADPTGLALGMLLAEMIEATIQGSQVKLERILREPDFMAHLATIQSLERELQEDVQEPRARLLARLTAALHAVSPSFEAPGSREVAICLRDAIYSMDAGLTLRWLQCSDLAVPAHVALCPDIRRFSMLPEFVDALRSELPLGAHLARIGDRHTAIGIKQPGRVAYLSSLSIFKGALREDRAHNYLMAEGLDLDTAVERYPEWSSRERKSTGFSAHVPVPVGYDTHTLCHLSLLPRDRLLWLAMVVEMAAQQMAAAKPSEVTLTETMVRALPRPPAGTNLPALIEASWSASELSLDATFNSLGLAKWEAAFLRPALEGMSEDAFFRVSEQHLYGIGLAAKDIGPWPEARSFASEDLYKTHVQMVAASPDLTGTREEVESARHELFGRNLLAWLLAWGNHAFQVQHKEQLEWFRRALAANLPAALSSPCVTWKEPGFRIFNGVHLYTQNPKRKTYDPRCLFDGKRPVTKVAHFAPVSSSDLIQMLGLKGEADLPPFLRGWQRDQSWTTECEGFGALEPIAPYGIRERWCVSRYCRDSGNEAYLEATVCLNEACIPVELQAAV